MSSSNSRITTRGVGVFPLVLSGMSFIPLIGVLFGIIAIVWGLIKLKDGGKKLVVIGSLGIGFTILLYGGLFYFGFVQRGGIYDDLRVKMAQSNLDSLVKSIEFYRITHNAYPDNLEQLASSLPEGSIDSLYLIDTRSLSAQGPDRYFYYKKIDPNHYYLRGVAADGKPFSPGALIPHVAGANLGLLTDAPNEAPPDTR